MEIVSMYLRTGYIVLTRCFRLVLSPVTNNILQGPALKHSTLHLPTEHKRLRHSTEDAETDDEHLRSVVPSPVDDDDEDAVEPSLRVGLVVHRSSSGFASRGNNLHSYLELNRFVRTAHCILPSLPGIFSFMRYHLQSLGQTSYTLPSDPENRSLIDQKAQISADSMIGRSTRVEERTSIKRSVIGKHCVIGKMAKIVGCVILDHCVIADGYGFVIAAMMIMNCALTDLIRAKLDGCILGVYTKVGAKAELSRCVTQPGYEVGPGGKQLPDHFGAATLMTTSHRERKK